MANEADLRAAATALRQAESVAGFTAHQLRQMWQQDLGMWGGKVTPAIHEGIGNSVANSELIQRELAARAADCDAAADTARAYRAAMDQYRSDLSTWLRNESLHPDADNGPRPFNPAYDRWGSWPSWVSE